MIDLPSGLRLVVTGGAGFIGSAVVRAALAAGAERVVNLDKLTYAGTLASVAEAAGDPRYAFEHIDICDAKAVARVFERHRPNAIIHLAAETHVDRSIDDPSVFIETNVRGTFVLLEATRRYLVGLVAAERERFRFHHVSTDEVFGSLGPSGEFNEESRYDPRSPYSASKASADHLVRAWHQTHGVATLITNCSNNYGPFQFPEKLIPLVIANALAGRKLPVYGKGENVRDWLYVEDHAAALLLVLARGRPGETYNIGGRAEIRNIDLVRDVCRELDRVAPDPAGPFERLIALVPDRPGHDLRYAIDCTKLERELGWRAQETIESGLRKTVGWYVENRAWWHDLRQRVYDGRRLGRAAGV